MFHEVMIGQLSLMHVKAFDTMRWCLRVGLLAETSGRNIISLYNLRKAKTAQALGTLPRNC